MRLERVMFAVLKKEAPGPAVPIFLQVAGCLVAEYADCCFPSQRHLCNGLSVGGIVFSTETATHASSWYFNERPRFLRR